MAPKGPYGVINNALDEKRKGGTVRGIEASSTRLFVLQRSCPGHNLLLKHIFILASNHQVSITLTRGPFEGNQGPRRRGPPQQITHDVCRCLPQKRQRRAYQLGALLPGCNGDAPKLPLGSSTINISRWSSPFGHLPSLSHSALDPLL